MVARVQKTAEGFIVPLTAEMVEVLRIEAGSTVELRPVDQEEGIRYCTLNEALEAFERTLPHHEQTYRALAK